jgi:hypothetical protein
MKTLGNLFITTKTKWKSSPPFNFENDSDESLSDHFPLLSWVGWLPHCFINDVPLYVDCVD